MFQKTSVFIKLKYWLIFTMAILILGISMNSFAQKEYGELKDGKIDKLNIVSDDLQNLLTWLGKVTGLTIIANSNDVKDKKFVLTNLTNVTVEEMLERVKTVLSQYDLTTIKTDNTLLIVPMSKAVKMKVHVYVLANVADYDKEDIGIKPSDEVITQIIMLQNAVAAELVASVKSLSSKSSNVFADPNSNSLVITDIASNIHRIAAILKIIDDTGALEGALKIKIIQIVNGDARSMAQTLTELFREEGQVTNILRKMSYSRNPDEMKKMFERATARGSGIDIVTGRVQIAADQSANSILVKASDTNIAIIENLVKQLDTSTFVQPELKVFRLQAADAEQVARQLEDLISGSGTSGRMNRWERSRTRERSMWMRRRAREEGRGMEQTGIVGDVNIISDSRLNAILVSSDSRNFPFIETIIKEIDQADPQEEVKIFFLKFADAQDMVQNLQDLIEGGSTGGRGGSSYGRMYMRYRRRQDQREWGGPGFGIQGDVNLVADERLNAILLSTAKQNIPVIEELITQLDKSMPEQEWGTKIYQLQYADAENVSDIINNVYQGQSSGRGRSFFSFLPRRQRAQSGSSLAGNVTAEAYPTLNALIVSTSTQRNFELIDVFIKSLDTPTPEGQREVTKALQLEYADAQELQQLLSQVWEGQSQFFSFRRFFSRGGQAEQKDINSLRGKVTVNADQQTNSLIITTRQRYWKDAEALIRALDVVRGQVWLDIEILEITLDESTKFGLELTTRQNVRLWQRSGEKEDSLMGTIASDLQLDQEISGFSYGLMTTEYMALIHTLMKENKVRTLSTPSILTRDNQEAVFSRGRRIPYLQSVETTYQQTGGNQSNQNNQGDQGGGATFMFGGQPLYNYDFLDNVGVNVTITPHIARTQVSEEGKRTIGLDITEIRASNFLEFTDFNAPITEDSSISAYIDVEDGQSILIGGMIKSKQQNIETKIPVLGSIPLFGRLFKKTETVVEDSEIIMIITPHIVDIKSKDDRERLEELRKGRFGDTDEMLNNSNSNRIINNNNNKHKKNNR